MARIEDTMLVERAQRGDADAFAELLNRYRNGVYATAYRVLGRSDDAQDVAQEALVLAYRRLGQLRDTRKFEAWLSRLTLNVCAEHLRRAGPFTVAYDEAVRPISKDDARVEESIAVREALDRLSDAARLTVVLSYLGGYTHGEVARMLDVPINTVRSRLQHAKNKLREEMRAMRLENTNDERPDTEWTRRNVEDAMRLGRESVRAYDCGEGARHYADALKAVRLLPENDERRRLEIDILADQAATVRYSEGAAASGALLLRALEGAREIGDRSRQANLLFELAAIDGGRDSEKAMGRYREALAIFRELGNVLREAESLLFLGMHSMYVGDVVAAKSAIADALPRFTAAGALDYAVVCRSFQGLFAEIERFDPSDLCRWGAICDVFEERDGELRFFGQPGFAANHPERLPGAARLQSVFYHIGKQGVFLDARLRPGMAWTENTFSYTGKPLTSTVTVIGDREHVAVPAGDFGDCLLTERVTRESDATEAMDERSRQLDRLFLCGIVRAWYAPGVGLVRCHIATEDGCDTTFQLERCAVAPSRENDLLPLAPGNSWEYGWTGLPSEFAAREVYKVASYQPGRWYLEHFDYILKKEAGQDRRPSAADCEAASQTAS